MKKTYSLYALAFALVLASGVLLAYPPIALAPSCDANCCDGSKVKVEGVSCTCQDNLGCTYTDSNGRRRTKVCPICLPQ